MGFLSKKSSKNESTPQPINKGDHYDCGKETVFMCDEHKAGLSHTPYDPRSSGGFEEVK